MYKYAVSRHLTDSQLPIELDGVREIVKMSIALALLPPGRAWEGLEVTSLPLSLFHFSLNYFPLMLCNRLLRPDYNRSWAICCPKLESKWPSSWRTSGTFGWRGSVRNASVCTGTLIEQTTLWRQNTGYLMPLLETRTLLRGFFSVRRLIVYL